MLLAITVFLRNTKQYNDVSYISFKTTPLCNFTLLPATVEALETFLEFIVWKPFQLLRRIHNVISITKTPPLQCWFQSRKHAKIGCSQVRRVWVISQFLSLCSLLRNPKPTGVLEHCREEKPTVGFPFFGRLLLTSLRLRKMWMYISLFTAISVNHTNEIREILNLNIRGYLNA